MMADFDAMTTELQRSLTAFLPELVLVTGIVLMLFFRLFNWSHRVHMSNWALGFALLAGICSLWQWAAFNAYMGTTYPLAESIAQPFEMFSGLLMHDLFTIYFRIFLILFTAMVIWLTRLTGIPDRMDSPDFYTLLFGATLGMMLMASSNHLLMVFISIEMASVPSYVMAGFLKGRRDSSEAAIKYVVYGAGAAGVMLYGISLLTGLFGTAHLPTLAIEVVHTAAHHHSFDAHLTTVTLALLMIFVGIAFKLAAVPFHFWCPDVFEGASTEVAAFLSVASKAAALALLSRLLISVTDAPELETARTWLATGIAAIAAMTASFGNLAAYAQNNLKRLLAYSTIAHAGYMMMPIAAALIMIGQTNDATSGADAIQSMLFYLAVYLFMNLGAFAVIAFIRNEIRSEDLQDYQGLGRSSPVLGISMLIFLFSLTGIPPLAGFFSKFYIFAALFEAGGFNNGMYWLLVVAAVNTVISLFYYVKILRVMILNPPTEANEQVQIPLISPAGIYSLCIAVPVLLLGIWAALYEITPAFAQAIFAQAIAQ